MSEVPEDDDDSTYDKKAIIKKLSGGKSNIGDIDKAKVLGESG